MMTTQALAVRAVKSEHWRWMPGMKICESGDLVTEVGDKVWVLESGTTVITNMVPADLSLPDLTDPATLGCLLAIVREAFGDESVSPGIGCNRFGETGWWVYSEVDLDCGYYPTEAGALVAALEAAPSKASA